MIESAGAPVLGGVSPWTQVALMTTVLELAYYRQLPMADEHGDVLLDNGTDVTDTVGVAIHGKWLRGVGADDGDFWILTADGESLLAKLWGPDRVPPGGGGYLNCDEHGVYDAHPGDHIDCPDCPQQPDAADRVLTGRASVDRRRLDIALAVVRSELARSESKISTHLSLAGVLLGGGLVVLAKTATLPAVTVVMASIAAGLIGAAVLLLARANKPKLDGDFGFVRWARASNGEELLDQFTTRAQAADPLPELGHELWWLSRASLRRNTAIARSVNLLIAGFAVAAVAALYTAWALR
jgi:hypothetical protein